MAFDVVPSGELNIACASCHRPSTDTGDGVSLPVGELTMQMRVLAAAGCGRLPNQPRARRPWRARSASL
nr:hypothetical protein [Thiohalocapsa sp.]